MAKDNIPTDPNQRLGWELVGEDNEWSFAPTFYPERFTQSKEREFDRNYRSCEGENISIKGIKNRSFHAKGTLLGSEIETFNNVVDHDGLVDIISPLTPGGGMECEIKNTELGEIEGYDPVRQEWLFKYTIDLVSTGRAKSDSPYNAIVTAITSGRSN